MVVDDSPRIIEAFENACKDHYHVISTTEGEKALELIPLEQPELVVLDWRLNGFVEGKDVLLFLKRQYPHIPVYVVTASFNAVKEIESLGADACLLKPCADLFDRIKTALPPEQ